MLIKQSAFLGMARRLLNTKGQTTERRTMHRAIALLLWVLPTLASPFPSSGQTTPLPADAGLQLVLEFPAPVLSPSEGGFSVRMPGEGLLGMAGCPDLPLANRHVRIPATKNVQLEVVAAQWSSLGWHSVAPLQERLHTEADLPLPWIRDEQVFHEARLWPQSWLNLSEPMLLRETRLVTVSVAPVRWNPVTRELQHLESLTLRLTFSGQSSVNVPLRPTEEEGLSEDGEGLVYSWRKGEDQFLRQMLGGRLIDPSVPESGGQGALADISWHAPQLPLNYLVIAKAAAQSQPHFQSWVAWKRQKGHHVTILGEAEITSWTTTGIRNAIIDLYQNSPTPPHYVALVGDTGGSYALPTHGSQYDHYYATISGNDILADVVVGRVSVENATQMATVFNKILTYEQSPNLASTNWLRRAGWLTGSGHCGESMSQMARDFGFQLMQERGYMQVDTAFCANSPTWVANWFNQGVSHYTYRGWVGMENLSTNTLLNMTNSNTPVANVFTCGSGDFSTGLAYTEAFLRGGNATQPGAAVAAMGFCTLGTHTAYNNLVCGGTWSALLDFGIPQVGTNMFRGKLELVNTLPPGDSNINSFSYWANLMGDPGMEQWCGVPAVLSFDHAPTLLGSGAQALELRVQDGDGQPVDGAAVCAWRSVDARALGLTDADGRVVLELPALVPGELSITASKAFCVPARASIDLDDQVAMPVLAQAIVQDEDGDGQWTPGEVATLHLSFHNPSPSQDLPGLSLSAELADAGAAQLLASSGAVPALPAQGTVQATGLIQLRAAANWTEGLAVRLNLRLESGTASYLARATLPLSTPVPEIAGASFPAGGLYPGQTVPLTLHLSNKGSRPAGQVGFNFSFAAGSGLSVDPPLVELDSLRVDEQVMLTLDITASVSLVPGYSSPLIVTWQDEGSGALGELRAPIVLGNQQAGDPTGPDGWGYYAFESTDSQWLQAPVYNWIEIAPNGGGTGSVVNLHDYSDEGDDSRRVELPFPFTLYGQSYSSMAVCSNGFVAFGPLAHLQTDFRNHFLPCGMGPEPMLAPMWDDFKLTGDAQVCVQHLAAEGIFVVEWYRVRTNSNNIINTFQLLLFDPALHPTPTGDGEVVFQYHTFSDNQSNSQDFPYCTIGLKNQDATVGLTLLNYRQRPATASPFAAGKAVRITTSIGLTVEPAHLDISDTELTFNLSGSEVEATTGQITLGNTGQAPLLWQARIFPPEAWPPQGMQAPAGRDAGGPDSFGYTWRDSGEAIGPPAGWVDMWEAGNEIVLNLNGGPDTADDGFSDPIDLPFAFPFYGVPQTRLWVAANGFVSFQEPDGQYWQNNLAGIPHADAPDRSLLVWWDDLLNNAEHEGFIRWWTNDQDSLVVTWQEAPHFNQASYGGPFTFQVVLEANGRITCNYGDMAADDPDSDSGSIGVQWDQATGFVIRHMQITRDGISIQILPPFWLELEDVAGMVSPGAEGELRLRVRNDVQGLLLPSGQYVATVLFQCNDPEQASLSIPVTLMVADTELEKGREQARAFSVDAAWPNPFNPTATIRYQLPEPLLVEARLFNVAGQMVGLVFSGRQPAGEHHLLVDGSRLASGVYLLKMEAGPHRVVRRLTLVK
jgi:hypothetical protein